MALEVSFSGGKKVDANFKGFTIKTDQSEWRRRICTDTYFPVFCLTGHLRRPLCPELL